MASTDYDSATGERFSQLLSSMCSYSTFPLGLEDHCKQSNFLIDLFSLVMDSETETRKKLHNIFQPLYESAPAVWSVDLTDRKASLLLEVLKLQTQKKPVELRGWSNEESVVRSFLQCLPYISKLR